MYYKRSYTVLVPDPDGSQEFRRTDYLWTRSKKERQRKKQMKKNLSSREDTLVQVKQSLHWNQLYYYNDIHLAKTQR